MIIDGREIANDIKEKLKQEVSGRDMPPTLVIVSAGENPVSEKFLNVKKKFAHDIGALVEEKKLDNGAATEEIINIISNSASKNIGIIVQLPLPKSIDTQKVLNAIPPTHDVDVLSLKSFELYKEGTLSVLPPVVAAIKEILFRRNVFVGNKNVVIIGKGKLVGAPAAIWFERHQSSVQVIDKNTLNAERYTLNADILMLGAGSPHFLKSDMIKEGVVILDAGTSESGGKFEGDADPLCANKASLFTPVPGGIGPVTVAMLFRNLLTLTKIM
ncbi:MAG: bifunctional 5,10-methylenetetrahydrofolate dehydrogenase/5,10-methenyltetrahydrofolate cyclohydrolase [Parcubacteria group bacterium]|nr:bifunctional 5,10-methylenetetrahydrofolate dehydrogenase/5,10-methenyltetrahydrofolate cyclohydrolase [Parcubacteria group bacterium]